MRSSEKQEDHLPVWGPGPAYVAVIASCTAAAWMLRKRPAFAGGMLPEGRGILAACGILLILSGIVLWVRAVLIEKVDDAILRGQLRTTGVYAIVRNPIYSAFLSVCTGLILMTGNVRFYPLPVLYWLLLTVLMQQTEERWLTGKFGAEYVRYCRLVHRCIPWFPKREERRSMTVHEFGDPEAEVLVMIHPLGVRWDTFELVIPELEKKFHLVIPAVPGFDEQQPEADFTSVEEIAAETADWLIARGYGTVRCLYGCSMGGGVVARMLADGRIRTAHAVMDGGMTPYRLPKILTLFIGIRDFLMMELGKHAGLSALRSLFDPDKYSEEDLRYILDVMQSMSARTIWRSFYSCNNYAMPDPVPEMTCAVHYWYGQQEKKARAWDIRYIRKAFPAADFSEQPDQDHAEMFFLHPEEFVRKLSELD